MTGAARVFEEKMKTTRATRQIGYGQTPFRRLAFCHYYCSGTTTWYVVRAKCDLTNIKQSSKKREGMARLSTKTIPSIEKRGVIESPGTTRKHRSDDQKRSKSIGVMHVDACRKDRSAYGSVFDLPRISPSELLNASYQYSNQNHQLEMVSIKNSQHSQGDRH